MKLVLPSALLLAAALHASSAAPETPAPPTASSLLEQAFALDSAPAGPRDAAQAAALYRQAAAAGDAYAHLRLGYLAETGDGVPQDYVAARHHYQAAVDAGLANARVRLAICHLEGWGGPVDRAAFVRELTVAAEAEDLEAQLTLAKVYFYGTGVPVDRVAGMSWLERAAKQDSPDAQYLLGKHLESSSGRQVRPNPALARTWFNLSADREYQDSMRAMAQSFLTGPRTQRDWAQAQQWLMLSNELGDHEAPYMLAVAEMMHPDSPTRDAAKATQWLELAEKRGNDRAREVLQQVQSGRGLVPSIQYVMSVAGEDRYVARANRAATAQTKSADTQPPRVVRMPQPQYPDSLRLAGISGRVMISFVVDTTGRVVSPEIVSSPHPELSAVALQAAPEWEFRPALKNGVPVNTRMMVPVDFDLGGEQLLGLDGMLRSAAGKAKQLGTIPQEDYRELRLAVPVQHGAAPPPPAGGLPPDGARALLLLVADAQGKPVRGYVLDAQPESIGPLWLDWALQQTLQPRIVDGQPRAGNYILPRLIKPGPP